MKKHLKTVQLICILLLVCTLFLTACNGTQQPPVSSEPESSENASTNDNNNINNNGTQQPPVSSEPESSENASTNDNNNINNNNNNSNNDNQISDENKEKYDQACTLISQGKLEEAYALLKSISTYAPAQEKLKNFLSAPKTVNEKWKHADDEDYRTSSEKYTYDKTGNILEQNDSIFTYDADGNVLSGRDLIYGRYYTYVYQDNRLYQRIGNVFGSSDKQTETYYYNEQGLLSKIVTTSEAFSDSIQNYTYTYYENGTVKTMFDDFDEYCYDENNHITKVTYYSDYQTKEISDTVICTYGEYGITSINVQDMDFGMTYTFAYIYNENGILTRLEVNSYYKGSLDAQGIVEFSEHQLCYSENPQTQERIGIVCYTNLEAALEIIW